MAGFYKLYVVGGVGGYMGADGANPIDFILTVGTADREWFEARYFRPGIRPLGNIRVTVPAGPADPNALIDACIAFDADRFAHCPSMAEVSQQMLGVERLDFDRGSDIPPAWARLRDEARSAFDEMNIWQAELVPVTGLGR